MGVLMLSSAGGLTGLALGFSIAGVVDSLPMFGEDASSLTMRVAADIIALSLGVSVPVGLVFGIYPALRTAELHSADALRNE